MDMQDTYNHYRRICPASWKATRDATDPRSRLGKTALQVGGGTREEEEHQDVEKKTEAEIESRKALINKFVKKP
jgi:hypothetical protein